MRERVLVALFFIALAKCGPGASSNDATDHGARVARPRNPSSADLAALHGGYVSGSDSRGGPRFIWAVKQAPRVDDDSAPEAALRYLARFSEAMGITQHDLETVHAVFVRELPSSGILARFRQRVDGLEVYPSEVSVMMRPNLDLVAISGSLQPISKSSRRSTFNLSPEEAFARALHRHLSIEISAQDVVVISVDEERHRFRVTEDVAVHLPEPGLVRRLYFVEDQRLVPAYFIEFYAGHPGASSTDAFRYILAADDGRVLHRRNLTANDAFTYRVWASAGGDFCPVDGPQVDYTPHPLGQVDATMPGSTLQSLLTIEGFNRNPQGHVDPWLLADAVETVGNNVDAYSDHSAPDGYSNADFRATTTATRTFDRVYDLGLEPTSSEYQTMASVTELFYVTNWLHDYFYDSGFDELAGNAQQSNFNRGGLPSDALKAEAQDGALMGNRDNANMSTPSDGMPPRMQMYSWSGRDYSRLTVSSTTTDIPARTAAFGPRDLRLNAELIVGVDAIGPAGDGCTPLTNECNGRIVVLDRGTCSFAEKALNAQDAGAVGIIIVDNRLSRSPPSMSGEPSRDVTIAVVSVTQRAGSAIQAALAQGPVTAEIFCEVDIDRDGSLDHSVVAHEWGHYLHHRLADCSSPQCDAMSEGWGDFIALHMMLRAGDDLSGTYAAAQYAALSSAEGAYFGTRRVPYSVDFTKNALTLRHISDGQPLPTHPMGSGGSKNSEVHNAGEVWATSLFEVYVALIRQNVGTSSSAPTFDDIRRRMADYVVAGLHLTPRDATYTEARDAILAAAAARNPQDMEIMSEAFARRGSGSCAASPVRGSRDLTGVIESFGLQPRLTLGAVRIGDEIRSCDSDGNLDAEERGKVTIELGNASALSLSGATVVISSTSAGVSFPAGQTAHVGQIGSYETTSLEIEIALDPSLDRMDTLALIIRAENESACAPTITSTVVVRSNIDAIAGSRVDDVESDRLAWSRSGGSPESVWTRDLATPLDHAWRGIDLAESSDTRIESPSLEVSLTDPLIINFDHRYSFETSARNRPTYFDGGVIEISEDDGASWRDIADLVDPGYSGALTDASSNPLALRRAFVSTSTAWPNRNHVEIDLGTALAGRTARIRFRIGTDLGAGDFGWEIDNIGFSGIVNAPFDLLIDDGSTCPEPLVADAGSERLVAAGALVVLDGRGSRSAENLPLGYSWKQIGGAVMVLVDANSARVTFVAPTLETSSELTFQLTVADGILQAVDTVKVLVGAATPLRVFADAGEDRAFEAGAPVILDGSKSYSERGGRLRYKWTQVSGPSVMLAESNSAIAIFEAPKLDKETSLPFALEVSDGIHAANDIVEIVVAAFVPPRVTATAGEVEEVVRTGDHADEGCGCRATHPTQGADFFLIALAAVVLAIRRR